MRSPISVRVTLFDVERVQGDLDAVRKSFSEYLDACPKAQRARSKHGLLGPVGKILGEVKSGRRDPASLKGYALRMHEATGVRPSRQALEALERGVDGLVELMAKVPSTHHDRVLDRLDYGLYFDRRWRGESAREAKRQQWIQFVRDRYVTEQRLSEAWQEDVRRFEDLYLPRKADGSRGKGATARSRDIADFWEAQGSTSSEVEDEEEA